MKGILAIAILLLTSALVFSQSFLLGVNTGMNYNILKFDNEGVENRYSGFGFGGGLVLDMSFLPMLDAEIDVLYSKYKYSYSGELLGEPVSEIIIFNNLVVPLLLKYKILVSTVSPFFEFGLSMIKNVNGSDEVTIFGKTSSDKIPNDKLETDFGLQIGLGVDFSTISRMGISPYLRFQYNLTGDRNWAENISESMYDILFGLNLTYKIQ